MNQICFNVSDSTVDFDNNCEELQKLEEVMEPMIAYANNTGVGILLGK